MAALTVVPLPLEGIAIRHLPAVSSVIGLVLGGAVYAIWIRGRILAGAAGPPTGPRSV